MTRTDEGSVVPRFRVGDKVRVKPGVNDPLVESVLTAFDMAGFDSEVVEELWKYAYSRYDRACKEAESTSATAENIRLMRGYLRGPRRIDRRTR